MGGFLSYLLWGIAAVVLVILLARSRAKTENKSPRGTEPGQGDQLIDTTYGMGGPGGGHGGAIRVTRDPQEYAKAFVPHHAKKKEKK